MNLIVGLEHRFERTPDGAIWTSTTFPYRYWSPYLEVFAEVRVVARVRNCPEPDPGWQRADGSGVRFVAVPDFRGPYQYLLKASEVRLVIEGALSPREAVILRGGAIAMCMEPTVRRLGHPYAVEVVADPYDNFAPGSFRTPLRPMFRYWFWYRLRRQCSSACAAAYVTASALQRRYPCGGYSVGVSDVELSDDAFIGRPRVFHPDQTSWTLVTVGLLDQLYKGQDVLIDAVSACARSGLDVRLVFVGDGLQRSALEERVSRLGLAGVVFTGLLPVGQAVRSQLDRADLFVLPSRQEGLPRAMIEAMARGLPCIGTAVGGIPELLQAEDLVPVGDVATLARRITEVLTNPDRMNRMSSRNFTRARDYHENALRPRRVGFYEHIRRVTEDWCNSTLHPNGSVVAGERR